MRESCNVRVAAARIKALPAAMIAGFPPLVVVGDNLGYGGIAILSPLLRRWLTAVLRESEMMDVIYLNFAKKLFASSLNATTCPLVPGSHNCPVYTYLEECNLHEIFSTVKPTICATTEAGRLFKKARTTSPQQQVSSHGGGSVVYMLAFSLDRRSSGSVTGGDWWRGDGLFYSQFRQAAVAFICARTAYKRLE